MSGRRYRDPATPAPARSGTARAPRHAARDRWDGRESEAAAAPARPGPDVDADVDPAADRLPTQRAVGTETLPVPAQAPAQAVVDEAPRRRRHRAEASRPPVPTAVDEDGYRVLDHPVPADAPAEPGTVRPPAPDVVPDVIAPSRPRRGRLLVAALAVVVLLAAGVGVLLSRGPGAAPPATAPAATGRVLLVQVVGPDGHGQLAALLGTSQGPAGTGGSVVLVPTRLLVDVTGAGTVPLADAAARPDPAAAHALTDLLGLRIDGTWTLPVAGLAALVDRVGGVDVQVDHDVAVPSAGGGELTLPAGRQHLDGRTAAAYATVLDSAEPEQARLARFDDVLRAVLAALPADPAATAAVVRSSGGSSTLAGPDLAATLVGLHAVVASGSATYDTLPVRGIDSGGDVALYGLDPGAARTELSQDFPSALQALGPGTVRVLVENGVGTPGLLDAARSRLVARGLVFRDGGNASRFGLPASAVLVPDATAASTAEGRRVAAALGLPAGAVQVSGRGQTVADVVVVLGADFRP
ncbi:MAG TPA: LCP family protein [Motilibacteraceae bacterium]|nr:LCP family protein [Motilibacteraceae bacterium]